MFNDSDMDKMKYINEVDIGLAFYHQPSTKYSEVAKRIEKEVKGCKFKRYDFAIHHYLVCKQNRLRFQLYQIDPQGSPRKEIDRLAYGEYLRKEGAYKKIPIANEITDIFLSLNKEHIDSLIPFIKIIGWKKRKKSWCYKNQCLHITETNISNKPRIKKVIFSSIKNKKFFYNYGFIKIQNGSKNKIIFLFENL